MSRGIGKKSTLNEDFEAFFRVLRVLHNVCKLKKGERHTKILYLITSNLPNAINNFLISCREESGDIFDTLWRLVSFSSESSEFRLSSICVKRFPLS